MSSASLEYCASVMILICIFGGIFETRLWGVGNMRLARLGTSSAIKVRIIIKDRIRDRVTFKLSIRAKV